MATIASLFVKIGADTSEFEKKMKSVSTNLKNAGGEIASVGKSLSLGFTTPILAAGAASFKLAADMQDAMGATSQIFKEASTEVQNWANNIESYYGITSKDALNYANTMGSMLQNIGGLTEKEAAKQSQTLIKLAGDLTAMFGGTTESAVQALTGALKGNATMLDNYGMGVNDATIKSKAFEMGIYAGKGEMELAAKQAATLALIMEQTGAAQGQAAREAEGASGSMRSLATEVMNLGTNLGNGLLPVITPIISKINDGVKAFSALDEGAKRNILVIGGLVAAIGPAMMIIGGLTSGIGAVIAAVGGASAVIAGGGGFIAALSALLSPAGLVLAAIAAIAAIAFVVIKNWEPIKGFFRDLWANINAGWEGFKTGFINGWESLKNSVAQIYKSLVNSVISAINGMIRGMNRIQMDVPSWVPLLGGKKFGFNIPEIPAYAQGTPYVPQTGLAMLHKGEAVIPAAQNRGGGNGAMTIIIELDGRQIARAIDQPMADYVMVKTGLR